MHSSLNRREWLALLGGLGSVLTIGSPGVAHVVDDQREFHFRHDHILGTSLDLTVVCSRSADAEECERIVLAEIERLRRLLSTYDHRSEISQLQHATGPVVCSPELFEVLADYEDWHSRTAGALSVSVGSLIQLWNTAAQVGVEPDPNTLTNAVRAAAEPAYSLDRARGSVLRHNEVLLNVNSIGRGYILGKAAAAVQEKLPGLRGLLINHGGDLVIRGDGWRVGVADPHHPEDNADALTVLQLNNCAVATSGPYQRSFKIGDRRYSHLLDPRTGQPVQHVLSATAVAPDNVTANALATSLSVLSPEEGLRLVTRTPGAECLLVLADGRQLRSPGWRLLERPVAAPKVVAAVENGWPKGFEVSLALTLLTPRTGKKIRRPYVAVWVEDAQGNVVKTLALWASNPKWHKDLSAYLKAVRGDKDLMRAISKATRAPGQYRLAWDGINADGKAVTQGTYTIRVEVNREHGGHVQQSAAVKCGTDKVSLTLKKTTECDDTSVEYGLREK